MPTLNKSNILSSTVFTPKLYVICLYNRYIPQYQKESLIRYTLLSFVRAISEKEKKVGMTNIVFIAASIDGYIVDNNQQIEWLHNYPNPDGLDFGFSQLMERVDALIMGRTTFETVLSFNVPWPYIKPVFVLSNTCQEPPKGYEDKISIVQGDLSSIIKSLNAQGHNTLYIDGGKTIQSLKEDLIDELVITTIPILLGSGVPLFSTLLTPLQFTHSHTEQFLNHLVQNTFIRQRNNA